MSATPSRDATERALKRLLANGPLTQLPKAASADMEMLLALAAGRFQRGRTYAESEVNEQLAAWLELFFAPHGADHVTLRRFLVDWRYLARDLAGTGYRLTVAGEAAAHSVEAAAIDPRALLAAARRQREERKRRHGV